MAELKAEFPDAEIKLLPSSGGVFEVSADGQLLYSKRALGRHAAAGEVLELVRNHARK